MDRLGGNGGLEVARVNRKQLGRLALELDKDFIKEYEKFKDGQYGKMSASGFARYPEIGRITLYKYINLYNEHYN